MELFFFRREYFRNLRESPVFFLIDKINLVQTFYARVTEPVLVGQVPNQTRQKKIVQSDPN